MGVQCVFFIFYFVHFQETCVVGEALMINESIELGRCLCIHAQLQAVDIVLQSLLYQRGVVPSVVTQLFSTIETRDEVKFVETYTQVYFSIAF